MELREEVLIITDSMSVNASVVVWALQNFSIGPKDLRILTQASLLEVYVRGSIGKRVDAYSLSVYYRWPMAACKVKQVSEVLDRLNVVYHTKKPGFHSQLWLLALAKALQPGASVFVQEPSVFDDNKTMVRESRACLERNLLFAGFSSLEGLECLDHSAEISLSTQKFELIAMRAKKSCDQSASSPLQNKPTTKAENPPVAHVDSSTQRKALPKGENSSVALSDTSQQQTDRFDGSIVEDISCKADDSKRHELLPDNSHSLRERIRERNRLYQRRRRARMTEEQKRREKERRRQYMQSRRVLPQPLPISYAAPIESDQSAHCGQQVRETEGVEVGKSLVTGEAGEAS
ncbi:hypothetical protein QJS10_CPB17g02472 [Acorus calamus]|uniref:BZIP domain-containing protein n=1 Tax=Acorus calamus TaxID=4465 RepID=A0AAV9CSM3_ACOCL|nr:hypothetical protein QJS10_CPB17g02472 [Acorus calamus]